jgi:hypothetical protein
VHFSSALAAGNLFIGYAKVGRGQLSFSDRQFHFGKRISARNQKKQQTNKEH